MIQIPGTFRNGTVVPDEPVDWPEGTPVNITPASMERNDFCVDGSLCDDSPAATARWRDWFDSLEPVFVGNELEQFEAELRSIRDQQKGLLPRWDDRVANLLK